MVSLVPPWRAILGHFWSMMVLPGLTLVVDVWTEFMETCRAHIQTETTLDEPVSFTSIFDVFPGSFHGSFDEFR